MVLLGQHLAMSDHIVSAVLSVTLSSAPAISNFHASVTHLPKLTLLFEAC